MLPAPRVTIINQSGSPECGQFDGACTFLCEFPEYFGFLDLGQVAPLTAKCIAYTLTANVAGPAAFTDAIAAINDPFFFSSDPVSPVNAVQFVELAPVPVPTPVALFASALALLGLARPRSVRQ